MKSLILFLTVFFVPFIISAQGCNANFNYTLGNCPFIQFIDNSSGGIGFPNQADVVSWNWDFGDGTSSGQENPTHQYTANGIYNVCLTIQDDSGCSDQFCTSVNITCIQQCDALFQYTTGQCPTVAFADNSNPGSGAQIIAWNWNFGDGTIGSGPNPSHQYAANGTYNVCLIIETSNGCTSDYCTPVQISCIATCEAFFEHSFSAAGCPEVEFNDVSQSSSTAQIVSWSWDFGDGTTGSGPGPTHQYSANGVYNVCLTIETSDGCTDTYCNPISISCIQQCEAYFQYFTGQCPTVMFDDNSIPGSGAQIVSWSWDFGDGTTGSGPGPSHQYSANGTYDVCLIIETSDSCISDYCTTVEINCIQQPQCEALFQYTTGLCPTIVFADNSFAGTGTQIVSWGWIFGDGTTGTGPSPTHEYTANGTYDVCLNISTSDGCQSDYCTTIEINCITQPQCEAFFQDTVASCPTAIFLDMSSPGAGAQIVSWNWDFGDGSSSNDSNPTHEYTANGTYTVCLIIETSDGCISDYCTTVEINCIAQCEALFQYTIGLCPTIVFADNSSAGAGAQIVSWNWDFGDGSSGTGPSPTYEYMANGTYDVCLTVETSDGCQSDYCTTVEINCITQPECEAAFQYSYTSAGCPEVEFNDLSSLGLGDQIVSWSWDFGDGATGSGPSPTHAYQANGIYTVCLIIETIDSCVSDYCTTIEIDCMSGLSPEETAELNIYPNPVTNMLNVDFNSPYTNYRIVGVNGVEYGRGAFYTDTHMINVEMLSKGMYIIEFEGSGIRSAQRFIKM